MAKRPREKGRMIIVIRGRPGDFRLDFISQTSGGWLRGAGSQFEEWGKCHIFLTRISAALRARGFVVTVEDEREALAGSKQNRKKMRRDVKRLLLGKNQS